MKKFALSILCVFLMTGCVHKVVTAPIKVAYKTTKGVVKGTAKIAKKVVSSDNKKQ